MSETRVPIRPPICEPDRTLILGQLAAILTSSVFLKSQRRRDLLSHLVRSALDDREAEISERSIAAEIYGRTSEFDPAQDSIVRVEMSRLRASLDSYYSQHGAQDALLIGISKSSYVPSFSARPTLAAVPAQISPPPGIPVSRTPTRLWVAVTSLFVLGVGAEAWHLLRSDWADAPQSFDVTALPGRQIFPAISPDHKRVAFTWDAETNGQYDIFVKPIRGEGISRLTPGRTPSRSAAWSPDGENIAFLRAIPGLKQEVYMIPAKGGPELLLTTIHTTVAGVAWTPDSRNLIVPDAPAGGPLGLFLLSIGTGERRQITAFRSFFQPAVSPDGSTLAFVSDAEPGRLCAVYVLPLGPGYLPSGEPKALPETLAPEVRWPTWSPDGKSLLYVSQLHGVSSLSRYRLATRTVVRLQTTGAGIIYGQELSPGEILLTRQRERLFLAKLPLDDANAGPLRPVPLFDSVEQDFSAALSPDHKKIAFSSLRSGHWSFWIADADGSRAVQVELPPGVLSNRPDWSPDSRQVYFRGTADGTGEHQSRIYRVAVPDGVRPPGRAELVPLDGADDVSPSVSIDGRWLYFGSNRAGAYQIWRSPIAGGPPELMASDRGSDSRAVFAEESAGGDSLYYSVGAGIWRLSLASRRKELFWQVPPGIFRVTSDGIYFEALTAITPRSVEFRALTQGSARQMFSPGLHRDWTPVPGQRALLVTFSPVEANIELHRVR